jgi:hypothetical protein
MPAPAIPLTADLVLPECSLIAGDPHRGHQVTDLALFTTPSCARAESKAWTSTSRRVGRCSKLEALRQEIAHPLELCSQDPHSLAVNRASTSPPSAHPIRRGRLFFVVVRCTGVIRCLYERLARVRRLSSALFTVLPTANSEQQPTSPSSTATQHQPTIHRRSKSTASSLRIISPQ